METNIRHHPKKLQNPIKWKCIQCLLFNTTEIITNLLMDDDFKFSILFSNINGKGHESQAHLDIKVDRSKRNTDLPKEIVKNLTSNWSLLQKVDLRQNFSEIQWKQSRSTFYEKTHFLKSNCPTKKKKEKTYEINTTRWQKS